MGEFSSWLAVMARLDPEHLELIQHCNKAHEIFHRDIRAAAPRFRPQSSAEGKIDPTYADVLTLDKNSLIGPENKDDEKCNVDSDARSVASMYVLLGLK
jgi:hypothetical protein